MIRNDVDNGFVFPTNFMNDTCSVLLQGAELFLRSW